MHQRYEGPWQELLDALGDTSVEPTDYRRALEDMIDELTSRLEAARLFTEGR